jgi:hypothetical protein
LFVGSGIISIDGRGNHAFGAANSYTFASSYWNSDSHGNASAYA